MARISERRVDKDPGWIERRFREVEEKIAGKLGANTPIPGGVTTVTQILTNPVQAVGVENTDSAVYSGTGDMVLTLSRIPIPKSVQIKQNGLELEPTAWTLVDNVVTVADGAVVMLADDRFTAWYIYDAMSPQMPTIVPTWRATAPQNLNGFLIPDEAITGDLLVAVAMMPTTESVTSLNGFQLVGVSDYVTHAAIGGSRTYRLEVYSGINDGLGTVPTVSNVAPQDVVCAMSAFEDGTEVIGTFDTLADGTGADAPEMSPVSLRAWGTIGDTIEITPSRGTTVLSTDYVEIDIAMTLDPDPSAAPATSTGAAGWCLASLRVIG